MRNFRFARRTGVARLSVVGKGETPHSRTALMIEMPYRSSTQSASTSTNHSRLMKPFTSTKVVAGWIAAKNSPCPLTPAQPPGSHSSKRKPGVQQPADPSNLPGRGRRFTDQRAEICQEEDYQRLDSPAVPDTTQGTSRRKPVRFQIPQGADEWASTALRAPSMRAAPARVRACPLLCKSSRS